MILAVTDAAATLAAQSLFREYEAFLRATQSCGTNYPVLDTEIATMPAAYADRNGEVLLAYADEQPAACIAYRAINEPATCEIKRIFVRPEFRGQGLARLLFAEAIARATARCFTRVILDTDTGTMPAALKLYLDFGFREYAPRNGALAFLDLTLQLAP
jgi:putative acetyltransferase